jgi:hypothetical protein
MWLRVTHVQTARVRLQQALRQMFANGPGVFPGRTVNDILIEVTPYVDSALERPVGELGSINVRRRLLTDSPHGVHVKVIVVSPDALSMNNLTSAVDSNGITQVSVHVCKCVCAWLRSAALRPFLCLRQRVCA